MPFRFQTGNIMSYILQTWNIIILMTYREGDPGVQFLCFFETERDERNAPHVAIVLVCFHVTVNLCKLLLQEL